MWANPNNMPTSRETKGGFYVMFGLSLFTGLWFLSDSYESSWWFWWAFWPSFIIGYLALLEGIDKISPHGVYNDYPKQNKDVKKPWGRYRNICKGDGYQIKILVIKENEATSLQSHKHRNEIWVVTQGDALITYGDKEFKLKCGDTVKILSGFKHRITNIGQDPLVITEVWLGDTLDEEDIIRHEDRYGRV